MDKTIFTCKCGHSFDIADISILTRIEHSKCIITNDFSYIGVSNKTFGISTMDMINFCIYNFYYKFDLKKMFFTTEKINMNDGNIHMSFDIDFENINTFDKMLTCFNKFKDNLEFI